MPVGLRELKNLDIVLLVCALPIFIGAHLPILGWIGGSAAYIIQRVIGGTIARGFFVALAIYGVGLIQGEAGAAAGFLFLAAFTVYFTMSLVLRPYMKDGGQK